MKKTISRKDIAIVGMSGRFAQSEDIGTFWKHLVNGQELVKIYNSTELQELGLDKDLIKNPNYVFANSLISNPENFDYSFFGYTKAEAKIMDPQTRLMHEYVWLALEDAACNPETYSKKIGLYLAASDNLNWRAHTLLNTTEEVSEFMATRMANKSFISTLISYNLNLRGPSLYLDTACSSSLTSIHLACRSLLMKECSMALAGASNIISTKELGYWYDENMISSKDGHCRAFDKDASGTFFGEGIGVVALKRLADAIEEKDHIYAVIKATAVNNDGNRKVGYTAPSIVGQAECIKLAQRIAGVEPENISYIEAHGTGTKLGDPVEIEALNKAFNYNTDHRCAIGSVKSNLGHLDTVAGVVGVIKTALAIENKMLPPSINYKSPNPDINFESGPFYVNDKLQKWERKDNDLLRAGVSSFGIGGTNAHVILEENDLEFEAATKKNETELLLLSARSKTALDNYRNKFIAFVKDNSNLKIRDLAFTLQEGRKHFEYKQIMLINTKENPIEQLKDSTTKIVYSSTTKSKKTVFMFSGGGSQYYKMAYQLYQHIPFFKETMDHGFKLLKEYTGKDFIPIIGYGEAEKADHKLINDIKNMLPILFIVEYALARLLMYIGIKPDYMIGHSLGEYMAACISGVFTFEDALKIVIKRGELTAALPEGGMVGVELSATEVQQYLTDRLSIATINMDDSCVISGSKNDIIEFIEILKIKSISYTELKISIAAHSILLDEILEDYREALNQIKFSAPQIPFISNLNGREVTTEEVTSPEYWVKHLRNTVNFLEGISYLLNKVNANYIEIGSGGILTSFLKQNKLFQKKSFGINILKHPKEVNHDYEHYLKVIGKLWQHGATIDWSKVRDEKSGRKLSIPGYVFDKTKIVVKVDPSQQMTKGMGFIGRKSSDPTSSFHIRNWKKTLLKSAEAEILNDETNCLFFLEDNPLSKYLENALNEKLKLITIHKGTEYAELENSYTINPLEKSHFDKLFKAFDDKNIAITQVVYGWNFQENEDVFKSCIPTMHLCQGLIVNQLDSFRKISYLGYLRRNVLGNEYPDLSLHLGDKTIKMVIKNNSNVQVCSLDIDMNKSIEKQNASIINDIVYNYTDSDIAYRNGHRWTPFYERIKVDNNSNSKTLNEHKNYLLINGLNKPGTALARHFCNEYNSRVILTDNYLEGSENNENVEKEFTKIEDLKKKGKNIEYKNLNPSIVNNINELLDTINTDYGEISGVIFLSNENELTDLSNLDSLIDEQVKKIKPVQNFHELLIDTKLDFFWVPTKLSSEINRINENIYLDTYLNLFSKINPNSTDHWISIVLDDLDRQVNFENAIVELFELSVNNRLDETVVSFQNIEDIENILLELEKEDETSLAKMEDELLMNYVAPQSSMETELCELWQSFLGFDKLGVEDNFFELGGNSLKAMTLLKRIQKKYNIKITIKDFFAKPTVKLLVEEINIALLLKQQEPKKQMKVLKV